MLAPELADFYKKHGVEGVEDYLSGGPSSDVTGDFPLRFIRVNPRFDREETLRILKSELPVESFAPKPVPWLDVKLGFYAVSGKFPLSQSRSFRSGRVYGMDVSSGAAVAALLFDSNDVNMGNDVFSEMIEGSSTKDNRSHSNESNNPVPKGEIVEAEVDPNHNPVKSMRVLDLCCSPGLKLCTIADMLDEFPSSTVVGVDISESRMSVCKSIVQKYRIDKETSGLSHDKGDQGTVSTGGALIRLFCEDGTKFGLQPPNQLIFDSDAALLESESSGKRKRMNKSARAREKKRLRELLSVDIQTDKREGTALENSESQSKPLGNVATSASIELFDRVLVDAECSTDGAVKHMLHRMHSHVVDSKKLEPKESITSNKALTDSQQLADLVQLQRQLILSGFRLLKPGGVMVYSTCSLSEAQNEDVVSWLLKENPTKARLVSVNFPGPSKLEGQMNKKGISLVSQGSLPGTVRFYPNLSSCDTLSKEDSGDSFYGGGLFLAKIKNTKLLD